VDLVQVGNIDSCRGIQHHFPLRNRSSSARSSCVPFSAAKTYLGRFSSPRITVPRYAGNEGVRPVPLQLGDKKDKTLFHPLCAGLVAFAQEWAGAIRWKLSAAVIPGLPWASQIIAGAMLIIPSPSQGSGIQTLLPELLNHKCHIEI